MINLPMLMGIPHLTELNVGHHLVARAVFVGLSRAIRDMRTLLGAYPMISGT